MAKEKAAKPKAKSKRGGPRPFSGRPSTETNKLRAEIIAEAEKEICDALPRLIANMIYLANGGYERVEEKWTPSEMEVVVVQEGSDPPPPELVLSERKVSIAEPDRAANQYLIDRILGKPTERKEVSGPEGGPVQVLDLTKMSDAELRAIVEIEGGGGT
jgi:hypothetical protein